MTIGKVEPEESQNAHCLSVRIIIHKPSPYESLNFSPKEKELKAKTFIINTKKFNQNKNKKQPTQINNVTPS